VLGFETGDEKEIAVHSVAAAAAVDRWRGQYSFRSVDVDASADGTRMCLKRQNKWKKEKKKRTNRSKKKTRKKRTKR